MIFINVNIWQKYMKSFRNKEMKAVISHCHFHFVLTKRQASTGKT